MTKKIILLSFIFSMLILSIKAQEKVDTSNKKIEKKVIIKRNSNSKDADKKVVIIEKNDDGKIEKEEYEWNENDGDKKTEKKITIMVDGDKVTINGKPIENLSQDEMKDLDIDANHLGMIAPHINGMRRFNFRGKGNLPNIGNFKMNGDMNMPNNKALLGVLTEKDEKGARISDVTNASAAEKAGLQKNDIITAVNDDKIKSTNDLVNAIGKYEPNEKVNINYLRNGTALSAFATLGENKMEKERVFMWNDINKMVEKLPRMLTPPTPSNGMRNFPEMMSRKPKMGVKVQDVEEGNGVKILEVDENSASEKAGLKKDDIITNINNEDLKNVDELRAKTRTMKEGETYKIKYTRDGKKKETEIKFPKKLKIADL